MGKVEEVDTDRAGDCMGQVIRLRVSMKITQPLKKILFIESEDGKKIPVAVEYEKLPNFCYCCGCIGHSYKECGKDEGQPKNDLAHGPRLKAVSWAEKTRQYRAKDRWNTRANKGEETKTQDEAKKFPTSVQHVQRQQYELQASSQKLIEPKQK